MNFHKRNVQPITLSIVWLKYSNNATVQHSSFSTRQPCSATYFVHFTIKFRNKTGSINTGFLLQHCCSARNLSSEFLWTHKTISLHNIIQRYLCFLQNNDKNWLHKLNGFQQTILKIFNTLTTFLIGNAMLITDNYCQR